MSYHTHQSIVLVNLTSMVYPLYLSFTPQFHRDSQRNSSVTQGTAYSVQSNNNTRDGGGRRSRGNGSHTDGGRRRFHFRVVVRPHHDTSTTTVSVASSTTISGGTIITGAGGNGRHNKQNTIQYALAPFNCQQLLRHPFGLQLAQRCAMEMFCVCI
jgi:hypothetical protein